MTSVAGYVGSGSPLLSLPLTLQAPLPVHVLREQSFLDLPGLSAADRVALVGINAMRSQAFTVEDTKDGPRIWAGAYIGVFTLASCTLHVVPKAEISAQNALYMLARTLGTTWELPPAALALEQTDLQEALADLFVNALRAELYRGVLRRSQRVQEELPVLRGRLRMTAYLRQTDPTRLPVEYTDLTANHPVNRVFALVLERLSSRVSARLRPAAAEARNWLREAGVTPLPSAPRDRHAFTLNRLQRRYQSALTLAWMLLDGWGDVQHAGNLPGFAFAFNMNNLYERFLEQVLIQDVLRGSLYTARAQRPESKATYLFTDNTLELKPDLTIFEGDTVRLIVDFKNKLPDGTVGRDDLYQMYAYAHHLGCERVLLLYPGGKLPVPVQSTHLPSITISAASVDLSIDLQTQLGNLHTQLRAHLKKEGLTL